MKNIVKETINHHENIVSKYEHPKTQSPNHRIIEAFTCGESQQYQHLLLQIFRDATRGSMRLPEAPEILVKNEEKAESGGKESLSQNMCVQNIMKEILL